MIASSSFALIARTSGRAFTALAFAALFDWIATPTQKREDGESLG
jgi:hypothetical protein